VFTPLWRNNGYEMCIFPEEGFIFNCVDRMIRNAKSDHGAALGDHFQTIIKGVHLMTDRLDANIGWIPLECPVPNGVQYFHCAWPGDLQCFHGIH
jgi:hypothetical protein